MVLHCTEPFIIILPSSRYDFNSIERDEKHQTIIIPQKNKKIGMLLEGNADEIASCLSANT